MDITGIELEFPGTFKPGGESNSPYGYGAILLFILQNLLWFHPPFVHRQDVPKNSYDEFTILLAIQRLVKMFISFQEIRRNTKQ